MGADELERTARGTRVPSLEKLAGSGLLGELPKEGWARSYKGSCQKLSGGAKTRSNNLLSQSFLTKPQGVWQHKNCDAIMVWINFRGSFWDRKLNIYTNIHAST